MMRIPTALLMALLVTLLSACSKDDAPQSARQAFEVNGTKCYASQIYGQPVSQYDETGVMIYLCQDSDLPSDYAYIIGMDCATAPAKFTEGQDLTAQIQALDIYAPIDGPLYDNRYDMQSVVGGSLKVDKASAESITLTFDQLRITTLQHKDFTLDGAVTIVSAG